MADTKHAPANQQEVGRYRIVRVPGKVAVLLNARAKGWTGSIHHDVQRYVSSKDLFLTDNFHQAKRTVERLIQSDYDAIFAGGGDGTIMYLLNVLEQAIREGKIEREDAPLVGVLRLGTGNALATYLSTSNIIDDLRAIKSGAQLTVHRVNMLQGNDGVLFPFAGIGWDADILNDYDNVKDAVRDTAVEQYVTGLGGYGAAITLKTIPRAVAQKPVRVRMTNRGERALRINYQGDVLEEFKPGDVMYEGRARICGAASIPYWGFQVRMFPHADRYPDLFQCRCYHGGVAEIVTHLRRFWRGHVNEGSIHDFLAQDVHLELLDGPVPYQISGDVAGVERDIEWKLNPHPVLLATPLQGGEAE